VSSEQQPRLFEPNTHRCRRHPKTSGNRVVDLLEQRIIEPPVSHLPSSPIFVCARTVTLLFSRRSERRGGRIRHTQPFTPHSLSGEA